jgi:ribosomal-protein-alanine N-acetyltransferase
MTPLLVTERLELQPLSIDYLEDIFALHCGTDVTRYIGGQICANLAEARQYLEWTIEYRDRVPNLGYWATIERSSAQFIGWFALKDLDGTQEIEIDYRLHPNFWCRGYGTEMAKALIQYAWERCDLTRIVAIAHPDNKSAQKVWQKCGLKFERIANYYQTDVYYYAIAQRARRAIEKNN